jgi:hypothetical protein
VNHSVFWSPEADANLQKLIQDAEAAAIFSRKFEKSIFGLLVIRSTLASHDSIPCGLESWLRSLSSSMFWTIRLP